MIKDRRTYEIMRPEDVGVAQTTLVLGKHSGRHAVKQRCEQLGYQLNRLELDRVYREIVALADHQKRIDDADVTAIVTQVQQVQQAATSTEPDGQAQPDTQHAKRSA